MIQSSGLLVPDTKLDLAIAPLDFLGRAAHLWDPEGAFGQLQNQAYGYLWPMGPFFVLGWALDLPGWVVQRLWLALVMCVALVGAARLSRALGVRSDLACIVAGFAFALSPRMLTTLGPISIEAWPSAMAPWVLLPLVVGATRGSPWTAAALSGLAVAMVGGVNAAATSAVLPLGALWLLTRTNGPRRWRVAVAWPLFTALGTLWWLVPLFVMGAYSPPFLDHIESAANTTFPTDLVNALRGTSNWVPYVDGSSRAGNDLITLPYLAINSAVVLGAGTLGLLVSRNRERVFLLLGVVTGLLLVSMGHTGTVQGWLAEPLQDLLDGHLAPLRNVHKFDVVLRLPLVVGLAWTVEALAQRARSTVDNRAERVNARILAAVLVVAVAGAASPAALGRLTPSGGFVTVPDYWVQAADWLGGRQEEGVALLVPGSTFGRYAWGRAQDEPMQVLASSPWAVRNAVPLTPAGNIRMLDGIEDRLAAGAGSPGFTASLRRAGVSHLVVRNDLVRGRDVVDPVLVHQTIASSPGLVRAATFGPLVGGEAHLEQEGQRLLVNGGWQARYPAIEVYRVEGASGYASGNEAATLVSGGPEDIDELLDLDVIGGQPTVLASDTPAGGLPGSWRDDWVLTDGNRAVERHFGALHDTASETLARDQPLRLASSARDYLLGHPERWSTFAEYQGIAGVTASSSRSDASAAGDAEPGLMPYSALDGRIDTRWESRGNGGGPPWWRVDLEAPRSLDEISLTAGEQEQRVIVSVPGWRSELVRLGPGQTRDVSLPGVDTDWLRVEEASGAAGAALALAEVGIPGVQPRRTLRLPDPPEGAGPPTAVVLRAVDDDRTGCATVDGAVRCVPGRQVVDEEPFDFRRDFRLPAERQMPVRVTARARPGAILDEMLQGGGLVAVGASSSANPDPRAGALAAVDGDPGTAWTADPEDAEPSLTVRWVGSRRIRGVRLVVDEDAAARQPTVVRVTSPGGTRVVGLDDSGRGSFRPIRTDHLGLEVLEAAETFNLDDTGSGFTVPVGISDLELAGLPSLPRPLSTTTRRWGCGSGPDVVVNGRRLTTAVRASAHEIYTGAEVEARLCGGRRSIMLRAGNNQVDAISSGFVKPVSVVFGGQSGNASKALPASLDGSVHRQIDSRGEAVVTTRENTNPGWRAEGFEPLVVDGWRQAWVGGHDRDRMTATFAPDRVYRAGLLAGVTTLLVLLATIVLLLRRDDRGAPAPVGPARLSPILASVLVVVGGGLLAGTAGAVLAGVLAATTVGTVRRLPGVVAPVPVVLVVAAVTSQAARPWANSAGWSGDLSWPSYLVLGGLVVALGAASSGPRRAHRGGAARRRIAGISTRR